MEEQLISFDTAKLAKEKGFVLGSKCYDGSGELCKNITEHRNNVMQRFRYEAPTQSLLQKWLRKEHGIRVFCVPNALDSMGKKWSVQIYIRINIVYISHDLEEYEEALERGLIIGLKLI